MFTFCSGCSGTPPVTTQPPPPPTDGGVADGGPATTTFDPSTTPEMRVVGDDSYGGTSDPSVWYPAGAQTGYMAYSASGAPGDLHLRVASSSDRGATWTYLADVNAVTPWTVPVTKDGLTGPVCGAGVTSCKGRLVHEVASIIDDATDPVPARRWKVFAYSYFMTPTNKSYYFIGFISLFTAPDPAGPWSAMTKVLGWPSPSPVSTDGVLLNTADVPELANTLFLNEPTALLRPDGSIDLALMDVKIIGSAPAPSTVLLRSKDHGASWQFVSTMLAPDDATKVGEPVVGFGGQNLFTAGGKEYLLVSPRGDIPNWGGGYRGCLVLPVDDGEAGHVARDALGAPIVLRRIDTPPTPIRFFGACTYAEGATEMGYAGFMLILESPPRAIRMYRSGVLAP